MQRCKIRSEIGYDVDVVRLAARVDVDGWCVCVESFS
jgi:hypothetical protein